MVLRAFDADVKVKDKSDAELQDQFVTDHLARWQQAKKAAKVEEELPELDKHQDAHEAQYNAHKAMIVEFNKLKCSLVKHELVSLVNRRTCGVCRDDRYRGSFGCKTCKVYICGHGYDCLNTHVNFGVG